MSRPRSATATDHGLDGTSAHKSADTTADNASITGLYALMDRYIDGDPRAFDKIHRILGPRLRGFLMRLVHDETAVDDLIQLTLLKAHLARARFSLQGGDPDGAVQGWYFAICRNVAMDYLRARYRGQRHMASTGDASESMVELADQGPNVEELGEAAEREAAIIDRVREAIARLPPGQREVVELHKLRGMTMAQIAKRLAVREGAVRVRAHRAYKALAQMLAGGRLDVIAWVWLASIPAQHSPSDAPAGPPDVDAAQAAAPPRRTVLAPPADAWRTTGDAPRCASPRRTPRGPAAPEFPR